MSWSDKLKEAGVNIHIVATGGGAGLQQLLWEVPGSSAYLSGGSFPYDQDEQAELLGFMPEKFVSEEAAIDLASAAYMRAYKFGGKKAVGLGLTASVTSAKEHRGAHRMHCCVITDEKVLTCYYNLKKDLSLSNETRRKSDGAICNELGFFALLNALSFEEGSHITLADATEKARTQFFKRPFFFHDGKRSQDIPNTKDYALMPGSFNPPHAGHLGLAQTYRRAYGRSPVFEVGTNPPHKAAPTVQELLQRAKMLQGQDRFFSKDIGLFIEKARAYPGTPLLVGADALLRMFDPKWGVDIKDLLSQFAQLGTTFGVVGRVIDGEFWSCENVLSTLPQELEQKYAYLFHPLDGRWDISSTELRNKIK